MSSCCSPQAPRGREVLDRTPAPGPASKPGDGAEVDGPPMVALPGGRFRMGTDDGDGFPADGEGPVREVHVEPFAISATTVTNAQFERFVAATGYRTDAERFGSSFVFAAFLPGSLRSRSERVVQAPWWCHVTGASWREPEGPGSGLDGRAGHPVVHIDWQDAVTYASWAGARLPTEAEWEYAARGGLDQARYPWGDELTPGGEHRCNIWQGRFPTRNEADDGYRGTAPVDAFPANGFGLHNVAGNVWEWCADAWAVPVGAPPSSDAARVMRGGSYLCHASYCNRYRVAARTSNTADSSSGNQGFRVARDLPA